MTRFRARLRDRRFWVVQLMVVAVTVTHAAAELLERQSGFELGPAYFVPASLYLFPVLYASLNFGKEGAIPTAAWSALLAVPNVILWHEGLERLGESFQMAVMILLAVVVASRVDRETQARTRAEDVEHQQRIAELKYRTLFETSGEACVVLDGAGVIRDANHAAVDLLAPGDDRLVGTSVETWLDLDAQQVTALAKGRLQPPELRLTRADGSEAWITPICVSVPAEEEREVLLQVLLKDVTERRQMAFYTQQIIGALENERQRIAQEIHDGSVQSLVLLCRQLDAISLGEEPALPEEVTAALADTRRSAEDIVDELRRFSRDLRPLVLDDLGLIPAVRRLVTELSQRSSIRGRFSTAGQPRRLSAHEELAFYRVAQEALRNAEQHSGATQVAVRVMFDEDEVRLTVADNGRGFDQAPLGPLARTGHLGLVGMQERARFAGGTFGIKSRPGRGTRVIVRLPAAGRG